MFKIDACGLSCPEPVFLLKKAIKENNEITLLVDNKTSVETCSRYAGSNGFSVEVSSNNGVHQLIIKKTGGTK